MSSTSSLLTANITKIMNTWEQRALKEVQSAHHQESLALRDSLPEYLSQIADALSMKIDRTEARNLWDMDESTRIGKKHGRERAASLHYTMDQMILEYHILRQVLFDVLEEEVQLSRVEREVIICSVEQAVNDAATQFSDSLKDYQEQLSYSLVHDLRNPLMVAQISSELILRHKDTPPFCINKTNRIMANLKRIDSMISELLNVSRRKAWETLSFDFEECDLDLIIKEIIEEATLTGENRFIYESPGKTLGLWNENGLRRMIENLTTNAVKYGLKNTPITFKLNSTNESAVVSIHNQGPPIKKDELEILFDQFRRSRSAEREEGWGIGLSVVKAMVDSHQGSIEVESQKDQGTTFTISLPITPLASTKHPRQQQPQKFMPKIPMDSPLKDDLSQRQ